jgi:hypothetical protein
MATEIPTLDDAAEDYGREQLAAIRDPVRECGGGDRGGLHRSRREPETALAGAQGNLRSPLPGCLARRLVSASNKLHNGPAILRDYRAVGDALWSRFRGGKPGVLCSGRRDLDGRPRETLEHREDVLLSPVGADQRVAPVSPAEPVVWREHPARVD